MRKLALATSWGELLLVGGSRAGEGTVIILPQFRLALDAGFFLRGMVPMENLVVSHGHMDHLAALLPWAAQRQLQHLPPAEVFAMEPLATQIHQLLTLGGAMEHGEPYRVTVHSVTPGQTIALRKDILVRFFQTSHWAPTLGSLLLWQQRQLKPAFAGSSPETIRKLRAEGVEVTETREVPLLAYLADTGPEVFQQQPWLTQVEVLVVECTFLKAKDLARAKKYSHMHLDDLARYLAHAQNRHMVLTHLSRRHRLSAGTKTIKRALVREKGPEISFLNVDWP